MLQSHRLKAQTGCEWTGLTTPITVLLSKDAFGDIFLMARPPSSRRGLRYTVGK
jgi:hypothetical protein